MDQWDFVVIGGGAAGFFGAVSCAEACPSAKVLILEATGNTLTKVKISGGGRCNVTHNQFDPKKLVQFYPRGFKELLSPFYKFQPQDTVAWFLDHGVSLKTEADGRMFPESNQSQTIVDCLQNAAEKAGVQLQQHALVQKLIRTAHGFDVILKNKQVIQSKYVLLACGSMPFGVKLALDVGHTLVAPVPSLFTFQIEDPLITGLAGLSFPHVKITLNTDTALSFVQEGPCLITHWGLSGPAVLKLSAFAARELYNVGYKAQIHVNWVYPLSTENALQKLQLLKQKSPKKKVISDNPFPECAKRFWESVTQAVGLDPGLLFADINKKQLQALADKMTKTALSIVGKGVFKDEFVTAGGVHRNEIDFRTMESKLQPGLYFAGEAVDVDGVTGGFNFQNAWTGSWLAGQDVAGKLKIG